MVVKSEDDRVENGLCAPDSCFLRSLKSYSKPNAAVSSSCQLFTRIRVWSSNFFSCSVGVSTPLRLRRTGRAKA
jgi:hypothetical protein